MPRAIAKTAVAENCFATLERELLSGEHFATHAAARRALFEFIEVWIIASAATRVRARSSPHHTRHSAQQHKPLLDHIGRGQIGANDLSD